MENEAGSDLASSIGDSVAESVTDFTYAAVLAHHRVD